LDKKYPLLNILKKESVEENMKIVKMKIAISDIIKNGY
jgi:hypothetical protein